MSTTVGTMRRIMRDKHGLDPFSNADDDMLYTDFLRNKGISTVRDVVEMFPVQQEYELNHIYKFLYKSNYMKEVCEDTWDSWYRIQIKGVSASLALDGYNDWDIHGLLDKAYKLGLQNKENNLNK